jgi:small-conductance mechanosensitive channel
MFTQCRTKKKSALMRSKLDVQVFENSVFLFFAHPFDVGDEIKYDGNRYTVQSINLQYVNLTSRAGADNNIPTSELRTAQLVNISRCGV